MDMLLFLSLCLLLNYVNPLFFKINSDRERCYIDEFLSNSIMVVKYDIKIESKSDKGKIAT